MIGPAEDKQGKGGHVVDEHLPEILQNCVMCMTVDNNATFLLASKNCEMKRDQ